MKLPVKSQFALVCIAGALSACGTVNQEVRTSVNQDKVKSDAAFSAPIQIAPTSRVTEVRGKLVPTTAVTNIKTNEWLKKTQVELKINNPTPLSAVVEKLAAQGLNIVSDLPLSSYTYTGKVTRTGADAALKAILGSVGLDFQADDVHKLVMIKPMASRSWFLNIGNRRSSYSSDGSTQTSSASGLAGAASSSTPTTGAAAGTGGMSTNPGGGGGGASSSGGSPQTSGTSVASADDFWTSLANELKTRLSVMMPKSGIASTVNPPMAMPMGPSGMQPPLPMQSPIPTQFSGNGMAPAIPPGMLDQAGSGGQYVSRLIGTYSLNPETGAISVQAPHWILNDLDVYFKRVQEMYNTDITFSGELVLVTSNRSDSEGFDLSAFATWAGGKYTAVISNNALGGITLSLPAAGAEGVPSVTAGTQAVAGPLVGLKYQGSGNAMNIFNAYLSEIGKVSVIQRPLITTTSGVPGVFAKKVTDYYNTVSQQAASGGTGSAATATQNTLVPVDLGTELRINPRIDISTGLIRAQLTLNQSVQSGTKNIPQTITFGNNTSTITTAIPLVTRQNLSGEVLLRDGDLIVVGGQTEDHLSADESGLPGQDGPMGGIFGTKKAVRGAQTYYFALRVSVSKRK